MTSKSRAGLMGRCSGFAEDQQPRLWHPASIAARQASTKPAPASTTAAARSQGVEHRATAGLAGATTFVERRSHERPRCRYHGCVLEAVLSLTNDSKSDNDIQGELRFCFRHGEQARLIFAKSAGDLASNRVDFVETHKTCAEQDCVIAPSFGVEGSNTLTHCFRHASAGMTYVGKTTCRHPGCFRNGVDAGSPRETAGLFCVRHAHQRKKDLTPKRHNRQTEARFPVASEMKVLSARRDGRNKLYRGNTSCSGPEYSLEAASRAGGSIVVRRKAGFCSRISKLDGQAASTGNNLAASGMLTGTRGVLDRNRVSRSGGMARPQQAIVDQPRLKTSDAVETARYRRQANRSPGAPLIRGAQDVYLAPKMGRNQEGMSANRVVGVLGLTGGESSPGGRSTRCQAQARGDAKGGESGRPVKRARQNVGLQKLACQSNQSDFVDLSDSPPGNSILASAEASGRQTEPPCDHPSFPMFDITCNHRTPQEPPVQTSTTVQAQSEGQGKRNPLVMTASEHVEAAAEADVARSQPLTATPVAAVARAQRHEEKSAAGCAAKGREGALRPGKAARDRAQWPLLLTQIGWLEYDWNFARYGGDCEAAPSSEA